jgi:toxin-antitoxin system PIN domain toxin
VFVVDTNVLVYAADDDSPFHQTCHGLLETWRRQAPAWYITWGICYEFLRVTTHPKVFHKPWSATKAWAFLEAILASPSLDVLIPTDRHAAVAASVINEIPHLVGNIMHDAETAILMREHGIKIICTRDTDFHRFPFLDTVDPLV